MTNPGAMAQRSPSINYFLPFTAHTGGVAVIFEHVRRLAERGYDVTLTVPRSELPVRWCSPTNIMGIDHPDQMRDADIVVATACQSAPLVWSLPPEKGEKFYFVQGYESLWCGNVDPTYRLPMKKIVVSHWLERVMAESFGEPSFVVHPAIDHDTFRAPDEPRAPGRRLLVMDHVTRLIKGTWVAMQAVEAARRKLPDIELVVFGTNPQKEGWTRVAEWHRYPKGPELARLYASCDVFVYPAMADGFGLPPLEAMACGTAVVTTNHTGTGDWASPDTCYVVPAHDVAATADTIVQALTDPEGSAKIAETGRRKAAEFTWDATMDKLEEAFAGEWQNRGAARRGGL